MGYALNPFDDDDDIYSDCGDYPPPSTQYLQRRKRDTSNNNPGVCQPPPLTHKKNPPPNTNENNNPPTTPRIPTLQPDNLLHTIFGDELTHSKSMDGNPCTEPHHVLCCLGPRQNFVEIVGCDFFTGALNCLRYEDAAIYCCLEVAYAGIGTWGLVGRYCE